MARGIEQVIRDIRWVQESDVLIHAAARPAYGYYQAFLEPGTDIEQPVAECSSPPFIDVIGEPDSLQLVWGFPQLGLLRPKKQCFEIRHHGELSDEQVRTGAWRSVLRIEPFAQTTAEVKTAKILRLVRELPEELIAERLPRDPKTGKPPRRNVSAFARALDFPLRSLNNVRASVLGGDIADVSAASIFSPDKAGRRR